MPTFISSAPTMLFNPLRQLSPLPGKKSGQDGFSPCEPSAGIYRKQDAWLKPSATRPDLVRRVAAGFWLASATAGALALAPQTVLAQQSVQAAPSPEQEKARGLGLLVNSKAAQGKSVPLQEGLQRLTPAARQCIQQLPADVQQVFVDLEPEAMQWMLDKVNGTTWVAIVPISNRDALVSGTALGTDVFQKALTGLKEQVAEGAIPARLEGRLADLLLRLKSLSPHQRGTLVLAMEDQLN